MSLQMSLDFSTSATSLPELEDGPTPSSWPESPAITPSGPDPALANLSARQARELGLLTSGTSGPHSTGSSDSAALTSSLVSKLHQNLVFTGGMKWQLTWKATFTPALRSIYRLRASGHPTSGADCSGWVTCSSTDAKASGYLRNRAKGGPLREQVPLAGWPTPKVQNANAPGLHGEGGADLQTVSGWATPKVQDLKHHPRNGANALEQRVLSGSQIHLPHQAGLILNGSPAPTERSAQLNPAFSRWLMGFPQTWCVAAILSHRQSKALKHGPSDSKDTATP